MKWKRAAVISAFFFIAAAAAVSVYGDFQDVLSVTSHISTGDVNIAIREYQQTGKKESAYVNPKTVMPGDVISKIPRIYNYAQPCWVRAKIIFSAEESEEEMTAPVSVGGMPSEWVKRGDYYYYTKVLGKKESVELFRSLYIPASWDEKYQDMEFAVTIHADAVQAANFQPDFQAASPWRDQEIQQCIHEENDKVSCVKENISLSVEFRGDVYKLMSVPDDFFRNFAKAMPGDVLEDSVSIDNTTDRAAEILFSTGLEGQSEEQLDLLERIGLELIFNGRSIYSGDLKASGLNESISLGEFAPGEGGVLDFRLSVPAELDNDYALRDAAVKWIFSVRENSSDDPEAETYSWDSSIKDPVKTGDTATPRVYMALLIFALLVTGAVCALRRKKDEK